MGLQDPIALAVLVVAIRILVRRWRRATTPQRRALAPVFAVEAWLTS